MIIESKFCTNCGYPRQRKSRGWKHNLTEKQRRLISSIIITVPITSLILIQLITINFGQPINPDSFEWTEIERANVTRNKLEWVNIVETKYATKGSNLYFLVKWNGTVPLSINSNNLTAPRYILYRKPYFSWVIHNEGEETFFKGSLLIGNKGFILFEFTEGSLDFRWNHDIHPFVNETTTAFAVTYQKGEIPTGSIGQISIIQASEYIGYHQYYTRYQSLTEIPESPPGIITVDGNNDDWNKVQLNYIQLKSDRVIKPLGWNFPVFEKMLITRTAKGIYKAISLSNENLTEFIRNQGNLNVKLYWATIIAEVDGSYAADYALETYLTYNDTKQYRTHNVTLTGASGMDFSPEFTTWQLQSNQSGTNLCFECFFPKEMIHPLYQPAEQIHFYSTMIIEWS
ncbi:MAG: hypothetical protein ACXADY_22425 [Candidatus Hodarchaeales archaeon]